MRKPLTSDQREHKLAYMRKRRAANSERLNKNSREYYAANRKEVIAQQSAYAKAHPEVNKAARDKYRAKKRKDPAWNAEQAARMQAWRKANPERHQANYTAYKRNKYATDPAFVILNRLRARLQKKLLNRGIRKVKNTLALTGCTPEFLRGYLEAQFTEGMQWNNVHIDHIIPCSAFDLTDPDQQDKCFHYTNLQPLFGVDNLRKGARTQVRQEL